jgi:hypothetical protein
VLEHHQRLLPGQRRALDGVGVVSPLHIQVLAQPRSLSRTQRPLPVQIGALGVDVCKKMLQIHEKCLVTKTRNS